MTAIADLSQSTQPRRSFPLRSSSSVPIALLALNLVAFAPAAAQDYQSSEYELKAAILFNLIKFVEWPTTAYSGPDAPTVMCTLGRDPFGPALNGFADGSTVNGRPLLVRRLQHDADAHGCHLLYISSSERKILPQILRAIADAGIVTVGEMGQFAIQGGVIQLIVEDRQVHFEVNLDAASHGDFRISSKLLALARIAPSQTKGSKSAD
jgi:hypothetical protein